MREKHSFGKRLAAAAVAAAVGLGSLSFGGGALTAFAADDAPAWASNAMDKMSTLGVLRGDADGQMHANRAVTRAEFISMLNRAFNYTEHSGQELPFEDMTGEEWYADNIRVAYSQGYFSGLNETTAGATKAINREEATSLLCRNLKVDSQALLLDQFTDGRAISQWARPSVGAAVDKHYVSGYSDGSFRPKRNISRAEAAVILSNSLGTMLNEPGDYTYGMINGNVTISSSDVVLYDTVVAGDLYITEGVGTGFAGFSNVTVLGEVIVCGGGEGNWGGNSVTFEDCTLNKLTVDGPEGRPVALYAIGNTAVGSTNVKSDAYLENHPDTDIGFSNVNLTGPNEADLHLSGYFDVVNVADEGKQLTLGKGRIRNLVLDEDAQDAVVTLDRDTVVETLRVDSPAQVRGRGAVDMVSITTPGSTIEMLPDQIEIRPGVTATINGQLMGSLDAEESSDAPQILSGYPKPDEIAQANIKVHFATNKPGTIHWALLYREMDAPTQEQILKPTTVPSIKQNGRLAINESRQEETITIGALETDVQYTLYALLQDDRGDVSEIKEVDFRTANNTIPGFVSGYPRTEGRSSTSMNILAMPTKDCAIYWVVMPRNTVAPTARQIRNEDYSGEVAYGHRNNYKKNQEYTITVNGLEELVVYDVYVMATDGVNDSAVIRLTGTTKDTTPPEFTPTTPRQDKVADRTVDVKVGTTENATVYYVVCERGDDWPVPIPPAVTPPALDSDEAKQAILTANNAFVSGRASVTTAQEATVQIRGLQPETSYNLYMALADAAGNVSDVKKIVIKTRDVIPPTAEMYFPDDVDGRPQVENEIHIVFSEEVWNKLTNATMVPDTDTTASGVSLQNLFVLYDRTDGKSNVTVGMDFSKVRIEEGEKGATVVVFPPEAFLNPDGEPGLTSGSRYQFELSNIVDTSGNAMKNKTLLDEFQTVPPLVQLTRTENEGSVSAAVGFLDATFSVEPQSNRTADSVMYDMILESDTTIGFELYYREFGSSEPFQLLPYSGLCDLNIPGQTAQPNYEPRIVVPANQKTGAVSLHYMIDRRIEQNSQYHFEKFNALKPGEYGIRITSIGSDTGRGGWNKTVNMSVKCISGPRTYLESISPSPTASALNPAIQAGNVSLVNYPTEFTLMIPFTDTLIPHFVSPYPLLYPPEDGMPTDETLIADTLIRPQVVTDRAATMYYLVAPVAANGKNTVDPELKEITATIPNPANPEEMIQVTTFEQGNLNDCLAWAMLSGDKVPTGGIYSSTTIENVTMHQPTIEGLEPEKEYDLFLVLKGTPPEPSDVWHTRFTTTKIAPPTLDIKSMTAGDRTEAVVVRSDKLADITWIVYPEQALSNYLIQDPENPSKEIVDPDYVDTVRNMIISGQESEVGGERPVDSGSGVAQLSRDTKEYLLTANVKNITRGTYYKLLGIGRARLTNGTPIGDYSEILVSTRFTPRDVTPPTYTINFNNVTVNPNGGYDGRITITFSEPLFYRPYEGASWLPVASTDTFFEMLDDKYGLTVVSSVFADVPMESPDGTTTTTRAMQSITMTFEGINDGNTIRSLRELCDASGNALGAFEIKFDDLAGRVPVVQETASTASVASLLEETATASTYSLRATALRQTALNTSSVMPDPTITTGISGVSATTPGGSYAGVVTIAFSSGVFFRESDGSIQPIPDAKTFAAALEMTGEGTFTASNSEFTFTSYTALPDGTEAKGRTLRAAKLRFSRVNEGDQMICTKNLCDANGASLNGFTLDFVDMEYHAGSSSQSYARLRQQSYWELEN